ncbi:hypothetical protein BB560_000199 [Smittium megazygosporum]|uniref:Core Histone H2A/H2B/H3 domain-containing protein n=1 Tax=Smittium megazygosporum TaxID=133381 RepID=A0A2T9ZL10_9FUNG|nr:hypothetical protein BB560_000199 [Smittium megazygosporum]
MDQLQKFSTDFWLSQLQEIQDEYLDFKSHTLPLARIKKVMKSDPEMISAEAPVLFSKACEIFIKELTQRAWMNAEENKRRTLQRQDVSSAANRSEMYDFLIDVVPRDEFLTSTKKAGNIKVEIPNQAQIQAATAAAAAALAQQGQAGASNAASIAAAAVAAYYNPQMPQYYPTHIGDVNAIHHPSASELPPNMAAGLQHGQPQAAFYPQLNQQSYMWLPRQPQAQHAQLPAGAVNPNAAYMHQSNPGVQGQGQIQSAMASQHQEALTDQSKSSVSK